MALISLFFQTKAQVGQMELDASVSETHDATSQVTDNEIEDGANVNDHVRLMPRKLTLEGVVSKTPLGANALIGSGVSAVATLAGSMASSPLAKTVGILGIASIGGLVANSKGPDGPKSRQPVDVYNYLLELWGARVPIDIVTALTLYSNMVMVSLTVPRTVQTVNVLRFTAQFQQVTLVQSELVDLSSVSSLGGGAGGTKALGPQATTEATAKTGNNASILYNLFGGL